MKKSQLTSRTDFREGVFARDNNKCVMCGDPGKDAHHILERRLWPDEGYYIDNGATVCTPCHIKAEQTVITCDDLRKAAGILTIRLPEHLYDDFEYDKWGNIILPNGNRLKGELFTDESVQKVLKDGGVLGLFVDYVKYPRTHHLPWSNPTKDDKVIESLDKFEGEEVVVTLKLDGEQTNMYRDHIHARSLDLAVGETRARVKAVWGQIAHEIPAGWRFCGENLWAKHSIGYDNLESFFFLFSIWNDRNECIDWDETMEWAALLGLSTVPVLYRGIWNPATVKALMQAEYNGNVMEGYVVRPARLFSYREFRHVVAKYVRPNHVTTHTHWAHQRIVPNRLIGEIDGDLVGNQED